MFSVIGDAITEGLVAATAWLVEMLAAAMAGFVGWTLSTVFAVTDPNVNADFLWLWASRTFAIAIPITAIFAAAQIVSASVRARQVSGVKDALLGSAGAVIGTMLALPLLAMIVVAIDGLADGFLRMIQADITEFGETISDFMNLSASPAGQALFDTEKTRASTASVAPTAGLLLLLVSVIVGLVGAFFLAFALLLRTNLLYVAIVALPIALSALAFEPTRGWPRKLLSAIIALAFGKLGIVVVIGLGIGALQDSSWNSESFSGLVGGVMSTSVLLLVAAFVPSMLFKFFDFLGGEAISANAVTGAAEGTAVDGGKKLLHGAVAAGTTALTGGAAAPAAAGAAAGGGAAAGALAGGGAASGTSGGTAALGAGGSSDGGASGSSTQASDPTSSAGGDGGSAPFAPLPLPPSPSAHSPAEAGADVSSDQAPPTPTPHIDPSAESVAGDDAASLSQISDSTPPYVEAALRP